MQGRASCGLRSTRVEALEGVQKDVRRTVSVMQYNILASCAQRLERAQGTGLRHLWRYLGKNTQPWFLYGADISPEAKRFLAKHLSPPSACPAPANRSGRGSSPSLTNEAPMARGRPGKDLFGVWRRVALSWFSRLEKGYCMFQ